MVQKLTPKKEHREPQCALQAILCFVTLLNFYLADLVKRFVKHFVNSHYGFHTNHIIVFNVPQWPKLKNFYGFDEFLSY